MKRVALRLSAVLLVSALSLLCLSCPYLQFTIEVVASPQQGEAPLSVTLHASKFDDREVDSVYWEFNDGTPPVEGPWSSHWYVDHEFSEPGTYAVYCHATEERVLADITALESVTITVTEAGQGTDRLLEASIAVELNSSDCPNSVIAHFTSTVTGGTEPYSYSWDFGDDSTGDGVTEFQANPTYGYELVPCTAVLTVTDDAGDSVESNALEVACGS